MAERGVNVTYESVREWCLKFAGAYAKRMRSHSLPTRSITGIVRGGVPRQWR